MDEQKVSFDGSREEVLKRATELLDNVQIDQSMLTFVVTHTDTGVFEVNGSQLVTQNGAIDVIQALYSYQKSILEKLEQENPQAAQVIRIKMLMHMAADANLGGI